MAFTVLGKLGGGGFEVKNVQFSFSHVELRCPWDVSMGDVTLEVSREIRVG